MTAALKIFHPKDNSKVHPNFATYGKAKDMPASTKLAARLKKNGEVVANSYRTLAGPPRWVIFFKDVKPGKDYTLEVINAENAEVLDTVTKIDIQGSFGIGITHPGTGDTVCADFAAYGTTTATGAVSATMKLGDSGTPVDGVYIDPGVPNNWVVQFGDLTPGNPYQCKATNSLSEETTSANLTVVSC